MATEVPLGRGRAAFFGLPDGGSGTLTGTYATVVKGLRFENAEEFREGSYKFGESL